MNGFFLYQKQIIFIRLEINKVVDLHLIFFIQNQ
jgi:hypothetical protein